MWRVWEEQVFVGKEEEIKKKQRKRKTLFSTSLALCTSDFQEVLHRLNRNMAGPYLISFPFKGVSISLLEGWVWYKRGYSTAIILFLGVTIKTAMYKRSSHVYNTIH